MLAKCVDVAYSRVLTHTMQPFYEDFPLTIERLRLTLLNSETLNAGELSKMRCITDQGSQMCIRIFVRHAARHGPYQLFSLGRDPSPDFPRGNKPRNVRSAMTQPRELAVARATAATVSQVPAPAASYAQLADENAALWSQMGALDLGTGGRRGVGRGNATPVQTDRPPQPRGGYSRRPGRSHHSYQGARMPPAVQQAPPQYTRGPFGGYNQPYGGPLYMHGSYMPATWTGSYGTQQYANPPPQFYGEFNGNQSYYNAQQANPSPSGASSANMMPPPQMTLVPQRIGGPRLQGQPTQHFRVASAGQQAQVGSQNQGPSVPPQQQASASGANISALHPEARPFTPGTATRKTIRTSH